MINGITKEQHVFADLTYVPLVYMAPKLAGFENDKIATRTCYALATSALVYSLLTDASWGLVKVIPYRTHAMLDVGAGVAAYAAATQLRSPKNQRAKRTLLAMALTGLVVGTLSLIGSREDD